MEAWQQALLQKNNMGGDGGGDWFTDGLFGKMFPCMKTNGAWLGCLPDGEHGLSALLRMWLTLNPSGQCRLDIGNANSPFWKFLKSIGLTREEITKYFKEAIKNGGGLEHGSWGDGGHGLGGVGASHKEGSGITYDH